MKQIKSKHQLQQEKQRLQLAAETAAQKIQQSWSGLKEALHPSALAGDAINSMLKRAASPHHNNNTLKSTLLYGIEQVAKNIAEKAEAKLAKWLNDD